MRVTIDADPVSHVVEIVELQLGRASFDLDVRGALHVIWHRDPYRIASLDARNHTRIHIEHVCDKETQQ